MESSFEIAPPISSSQPFSLKSPTTIPGSSISGPGTSNLGMCHFFSENKRPSRLSTPGTVEARIYCSFLTC